MIGYQRVKMVKKPHKKGKKVFKRLVKQRKGKVQKPGEYQVKMEGQKYTPKVGSFWPKLASHEDI